MIKLLKWPSLLKRILKTLLRQFGLEFTTLDQKFSKLFIVWSVKQQGLGLLIDKLRAIEPDVSDQQSSGKEAFNDYWELKRRALQAFQCKLMLKVVEGIGKGKITVVDIGDSAGTHMLYLKELTKEKYEIESIGVNLDPRAIEKIKARGQKAILCRAEDLDLVGQSIDLFTSFEMVEHLHNPALFFRRLAKKAHGNRMLITVPYLGKSRVGLHNIRTQVKTPYFAENEHIFELSPEDWKLLLLHSGWKVSYDEIYYQYPVGWLIISRLLAVFWRKRDYEGFWGAVLEKDTALSDLYQDWED